jgi:hypothetical protein
MGFIHATPGDMKSFRSSAERMALMVVVEGYGGDGKRKRTWNAVLQAARAWRTRVGDNMQVERIQ